MLRLSRSPTKPPQGHHRGAGTSCASPDGPEMAFVVVDTWQGRGVRSILMRHLLKIAGDATLQELTAESAAGKCRQC